MRSSGRFGLLSEFRNSVFLWTAFACNLVLFLHFDIPMYPLIGLVFVSEYSTLVDLHAIFKKRFVTVT